MPKWNLAQKKDERVGTDTCCHGNKFVGSSFRLQVRLTDRQNDIAWSFGASKLITRNGNGSLPGASSPQGGHVTIRNIQFLPKSLSHNIRQCESPPRPGSHSHGTLIGNQYGATQPRPKMPFCQNVLSH
ncbi:uncharacterized [Tachysurus ichikawai]